ERGDGEHEEYRLDRDRTPRPLQRCHHFQGAHPSSWTRRRAEERRCHHPRSASSHRGARSVSVTRRGESFVTRASGTVPCTGPGLPASPYPPELSPFGIFSRCMTPTSRSERIFPASSGFARDTSAPRISAAIRCRPGLAWAVQRKTEGALRMTDIPCGTMG